MADAVGGVLRETSVPKAIAATRSEEEQVQVNILQGAVEDLPCVSEPELFFADDPRDLRRAKALCRSCPVQAACLSAALQRGEPCGVWGGELLLGGAVVAGKRPRGRPRKSSLAA
jgi:WhiB family transcriptional regulator, redox-sensing transcriptional regulator